MYIYIYICTYVCVCTCICLCVLAISATIGVFMLFVQKKTTNLTLAVSRLEELLLKGGGQAIQRQESAQEEEALTWPRAGYGWLLKQNLRVLRSCLHSKRLAPKIYGKEVFLVMRQDLKAVKDSKVFFCL